MNRIIAVDYGAKKTGVAISDENQKIAFPVGEFATKDLIKELEDLIKKNDVKKIVFGDSKNSNFQDNPIMKEVHEFAKNLETKNPEIKIVFQNEFLTTAQAIKTAPEGMEVSDSTSAAIILQTFLDYNL
jgi:putative Holliday junction resolvase